MPRVQRPTPATARGRDLALWLAGAVISVALAVALYTRFGINGALSRDEGIYTYGGQQLTHGVPPYASIFDPKTPLATMIAGAAAAVARAVGRNDIYLIRVAFFACSVLTVLAVYVLAVRLWRSVVAGLVAALVFTSFDAFAVDALSGPDAKTPGILLAVVSMWLTARRQWFWAALAGGLAFLVWQPLVFYPVVTVLVAGVYATPGRRLRALGGSVLGAAIPVILVTCYFAVTGALAKFLESAVIFPAVGIQRGTETVAARLAKIATVVHQSCGLGGVLFWAGLLLLLLVVAATLGQGGGWRRALREPLVCVVLTTFVAQAGYAASDFQGYPDLYPLLPYAGLGVGGAVGLAMNRLRHAPARVATTVFALVGVVALTGFSWSSFTNNPMHNDDFMVQRSSACAISRVLVPGHPLYSLGDPRPLALTHRRNPDRFIYLGSGVDHWKIAHTPGGLEGWAAQIRAAHPSVVVLRGWHTKVTPLLVERLKAAGYRQGYIGQWRVFLGRAARARAHAQGVKVTHRPTEHALDRSGRELSTGRCG